MSRPWRIEYAGAFYWVESRGNDEGPVFTGIDERAIFLQMLGRMSSRFDVEIFVYALMDHRYDLLLATRRPNLSRGMHWLGTTYTRRFNLKYARTGHLFQGRYRSALIEDARGVMELSWSIHRRACAVEDASRSGYPFSSLAAYTSGAPHPPWLKTNLILAQCGAADRRRAYREMLWTAPDEAALIRRRMHHGILYGSRDFVERIKALHLIGEPHPDVPSQMRLFRDRGPDALLREASTLLKAGNLTLSDSAGRTDRDLRMYALWRAGSFTNREIGILFGLSHSAVSRRMKHTEARCRADPGLALRVESLATGMPEDIASEPSPCTENVQN